MTTDGKLYYGTCDDCGYFGEIYAVPIPSGIPGINGRKYVCANCEQNYRIDQPELIFTKESK